MECFQVSTEVAEARHKKLVLRFYLCLLSWVRNHVILAKLEKKLAMSFALLVSWNFRLEN